MFEKAVRDGWLDLTEIADLLEDIDYRLSRMHVGVTVEEWCEAFKIPVRWVYPRPRKSATTCGRKHLGAAELADLLISLERIGYALDATPLVNALLPLICKKDEITDSELAVFDFEARRHKMDSLTFEATDFPGISKFEKRRTPGGHKLEAWLDADGKAFHLTIGAPKYRKPREQKFVTCADCGVEWLTGDPDSVTYHRREHRTRLRYLRPKTIARYVADAADPDRRTVNALSPRWKHREMFERARLFTREMGYSFPQWTCPDSPPDVEAIGILFDIDDVIVGSCSFRLRGATWCMDWIWIAPMYRRSGVLTRYWPELRTRFGDFPLEPPVSDAMQAFVKKIGSMMSKTES